MPRPKGSVSHTPLMLAVNRDHYGQTAFPIWATVCIKKQAAGRKGHVSALSLLSQWFLFCSPSPPLPPMPTSPIVYEGRIQNWISLMWLLFFLPFPVLKKKKRPQLKNLWLLSIPRSLCKASADACSSNEDIFTQLWLRTVMLRDPRYWLGWRWPYVFTSWWFSQHLSTPRDSFPTQTHPSHPATVSIVETVTAYHSRFQVFWNRPKSCD